VGRSDPTGKAGSAARRSRNQTHFVGAGLVPVSANLFTTSFALAFFASGVILPTLF
jgi:hypothetical protein